MRKAFLYTAAAGSMAATLGWLGWTFPAFAADLALKAPRSAIEAPYTWSGPWVGLYIGGGLNTTNAQAATAKSTLDLGNTPRGVVGGVGIGYDFQFAPQFVFGLFAEGALANLNDSGSLVSPIGVGTVSNSMATNYLLAGGARLGWLITPQSMLYLKGGAAGVGEKPNWQVMSVSQGVQDTAGGWMAGGGLEHRITNNWSVRLEYEHFRAGDRQFGFTDSSGATVLTASNKTQIDMATIGLNYRF